MASHIPLIEDGRVRSASSVPLPASGQLFSALVDWVENGNAPSSIVLRSSDASVSQPVCAFPKKAVYDGTGSIRDAANYICQ